MKKLILVIALVVAYGVSVSAAKSIVVNVEKAKVTVVADDNKTTPDGKDKKAKVEKTEGTEKSSGCCSEKKEGCCSEKKAGCCSEKKEGCSSEKKEGCCSEKKACGEKATEPAKTEPQK